MIAPLGPCPDCRAPVGDLHHPGCDVERCSNCGGQLISCNCPAEVWPRLPWTGVWPGEAECAEFGWYAVVNPAGPGWVSCAPGTPAAVPDLNRLHRDATWDPARGRFVRVPVAAN